ncbi:MAG: HD domain-containing protein [Clostridiales bacterium]|nr:HD domain-containing protein [Clostridiales bacterium]
MENYTVCQLQRDMRYEGFLLIRSAEKRKDSKGNDYVDMNLTDRTGEINCKIWNWDPEAETPEAGQPIKVRGTIQEYNGRLQLRVEKWRLCTEDDPVDMNALVPCAPRKPEDMFKDIEDAIEHFADEDLKKLTRGMLNLAGDRLRWFPAAQRMHHAERSGLLHHTTDMLRLADAMLNIYPWLNRDLLKAGVIIHDLGKIDEMKSDQTGNVTDYTRDGQLLGHLVRGITNLNKVAEETGVTGECLILLEHMLLSHHGESEFGSPKPPMFPEAEALHWIDIMDARMNTMKSVTDKTPPGAFSEKIFSLDRRVYHPLYGEENE